MSQAEEEKGNAEEQGCPHAAGDHLLDGGASALLVLVLVGFPRDGPGCECLNHVNDLAIVIVCGEMTFVM